MPAHEKNYSMMNSTNHAQAKPAADCAPNFYSHFGSAIPRSRCFAGAPSKLPETADKFDFEHERE